MIEQLMNEVSCHAHSHVSGGLSVLSVVGVKHALVHVFALRHTGHEEPQDNHDEDALPHGGGDIVPHLLIEQVNLLHALKVVQP